MPEKNLIKFDIRTLRRNIQKGIISKTEYEGYLKTLSDEEGNYELVPLSEEISTIISKPQSSDSNQNSIGEETTQEIK